MVSDVSQQNRHRQPTKTTCEGGVGGRGITILSVGRSVRRVVFRSQLARNNILRSRNCHLPSSSYPALLWLRCNSGSGCTPTEELLPFLYTAAPPQSHPRYSITHPGVHTTTDSSSGRLARDVSLSFEAVWKRRSFRDLQYPAANWHSLVSHSSVWLAVVRDGGGKIVIGWRRNGAGWPIGAAGTGTGCLDGC